MKLRDFARSFETTWGVGALVTTVGPLALWRAAGLDPPWPTPGAAATVSSLVCALILVLAYSTAATLKSNAKLHRRARRWLVAGIVLLFVYLGLHGSLVLSEQRQVEEVEQTLSFVIGFERLDGVPSDLSDRRALRESLYRPSEVWTLRSLSLARLGLLVTFCAAFGAMTYGLGLASACEARS